MVIDKATGKGCALSIVSKTITEKLVTDGIVGKTICRKKHEQENSYDLFRTVKFMREENVYVVAEKSGDVTEKPLWPPTFIDAGVWKQAVSRFPAFGRLDESVEKYLLPKMDEYLQSISDVELVSLTRYFLIKHSVTNKPICQHNGKTYYFDKNELSQTE